MLALGRSCPDSDRLHPSIRRRCRDRVSPPSRRCLPAPCVPPPQRNASSQGRRLPQSSSPDAFRPPRSCLQISGRCRCRLPCRLPCPALPCPALRCPALPPAMPCPAAVPCPALRRCAALRCAALRCPALVLDLAQLSPALLKCSALPCSALKLCTLPCSAVRFSLLSCAQLKTTGMPCSQAHQWRPRTPRTASCCRHRPLPAWPHPTSRQRLQHSQRSQHKRR